MATVAGTSAELEALSQEFNYLVNNIDIGCLLPAALNISLITQQQRLECFHEPNPFMKAQKFLSHLLEAVKGDSNKYYTFIQILQETDQASIASHLQGYSYIMAISSRHYYRFYIYILQHRV